MKPKFKQTRVISGREARRIGEREKKREQRLEDVQRFWNLSPEERQQRIKDNETFQRIQRNGITLEDVRDAENRAYQDGVKVGIESTMRMCYAAMCLALKELHGFGTKRCMDMLNAVDEKVVYALTSEELVDQVFKDLNLQITFKNDMPGERIVEVE